MEIIAATHTVDEPGPLTNIVNSFVEAQMQVTASGPTSDEDWAPMAQFIAVDQFRRVGAYLEEFDWHEYRRFLTGWTAGGTRFEFTQFFISEIGNAVFQEIEERHYRGEQFIQKNVIAVYRFTEDRKIHRLDIYEQAKDSGNWIKDSATNAKRFR
jgi:hypothetical protein